MPSPASLFYCQNPLSLRSQCAHWLWQSASPVLSAPLPKEGWHGEAVTGGFLPRTSCNLSVGAGFSCPPSCQPIPGHCRVRQSGHFLETGSLHPPPAALRRFPRPPTLCCTPGRARGPCPTKMPCRAGLMCPAAHGTINNYSVGATLAVARLLHFRRGGRLCPPARLCTALLTKNGVIARPVRTLAVAIRVPHTPFAPI